MRGEMPYLDWRHRFHDDFINHVRHRHYRRHFRLWGLDLVDRGRLKSWACEKMKSSSHCTTDFGESLTFNDLKHIPALLQIEVLCFQVLSTNSYRQYLGRTKDT